MSLLNPYMGKVFQASTEAIHGPLLRQHRCNHDVRSEIRVLLPDLIERGIVGVINPVGKGTSEGYSPWHVENQSPDRTESPWEPP